MNIGLLAAFKYMPFFLQNWSAVSGRPAPEWHWILPLSLSFYVFQALTYTHRPVSPRHQGHQELPGASGRGFLFSDHSRRADHASVFADRSVRKAQEAGSGRRRTRAVPDRHGIDEEAADRGFSGGESGQSRVRFSQSVQRHRDADRCVRLRARKFITIFPATPISRIGSALLLGIKLPQNFNRPYAAENIADFWRRWHITLSNWLRDYLYFSLPGKRSKVMPYVNLVITMVIGGLWHGASWNFVIWGALHGIGLAAVR